MDRPIAREDADARGLRPDGPRGPVLASRRPALDAALGAIEAGPILITGDSGVGKTWLWRSVEAECPGSWRWAAVDLTPSNGPVDLYRLIGQALGDGELGSGTAGSARADLADRLAEDHADGRGAALVVEEAHNLSLDVWEEVRALGNRVGEPGGLAALVISGPSSLGRRMATRPLAAVESRLAAAAALGPIDADEAADLLAWARPDRPWSAAEVDRLHRDALGNPRRLLRLAAAARPSTVSARVAGARQPQAMPAPASAPAPLLGPARPPLRVEEHLIEVGWSAEDDARPAEAPAPAAPPVGEESIVDAYASLQARREWAGNWAAHGPGNDPVAGDDEDPDDESDLSPEGRTFRREGRQGFAPLGPLFTRLSRPDPAETD